MLSLGKGHANLSSVPILVYVLSKRAKAAPPRSRSCSWGSTSKPLLFTSTLIIGKLRVLHRPQPVLAFLAYLRLDSRVLPTSIFSSIREGCKRRKQRWKVLGLGLGDIPLLGFSGTLISGGPIGIRKILNLTSFSG